MGRLSGHFGLFVCRNPSLDPQEFERRLILHMAVLPHKSCESLEWLGALRLPEWLPTSSFPGRSISPLL